MQCLDGSADPVSGWSCRQSLVTHRSQKRAKRRCFLRRSRLTARLLRSAAQATAPWPRCRRLRDLRPHWRRLGSAGSSVEVLPLFTLRSVAPISLTHLSQITRPPLTTRSPHTAHPQPPTLTAPHSPLDTCSLMATTSLRWGTDKRACGARRAVILGTARS